MTTFATRALTGYWVHTCTVERYNGSEAYGDDFDAPVTVTGFYSDKTVYNAGEIVAQGRFAFPADIAYVPVQSRVTLPAEFGTKPDGSPRTYRVVSSEVANGGGLDTPDHQVVGMM